MTVSTTSVEEQFDGDGSTSTFPFSFQVLTKDEITVFATNTTSSTLNGVSPFSTLELTRGTDYTVTLTDPGGTVTTNGNIATGLRLTVKRESKITQDIDYVENDPFPAATHEEGLDRAVMRDQERKQAIQRTLRIGSGDDQNVDMTLPLKSQRKNSALAFDNDGQPTTFSGFVDSDQVPVTSFMETLLDDTTATEARTTLGVSGQADRFATTTGTSSAYTASPNSPTQLATGETVFLEAHVLSAPGATLNVNGTGAKKIFQENLGQVQSSQFRGYKAFVFDASLDSGAGGWVMLASNPNYFNGQPASFYTNIPARLGFTPANKAGETFTGTVRVPHQTQFQSKDSAGNNRQVAGIGGNNWLNLADVNLAAVNLVAKDNSSALVNGNKIWNEANDGAGSGLNADKVDGLDASQIGSIASFVQGFPGHIEFNNGIKIVWVKSIVNSNSSKDLNTTIGINTILALVSTANSPLDVSTTAVKNNNSSITLVNHSGLNITISAIAITT